jgi:hypothetical protein
MAESQGEAWSVECRQPFSTNPHRNLQEYGRLLGFGPGNDPEWAPGLFSGYTADFDEKWQRLLESGSDFSVMDHFFDRFVPVVSEDRITRSTGVIEANGGDAVRLRRISGLTFNAKKELGNICTYEIVAAFSEEDGSITLISSPWAADSFLQAPRLQPDKIEGVVVPADGLSGEVRINWQNLFEEHDLYRKPMDIPVSKRDSNIWTLAGLTELQEQIMRRLELES